MQKVAATYITDILTLLNSFGEYMVVAAGDQTKQVNNETIEIFTLKMQPGLSVMQYQEIILQETIAAWSG